MPHSKQSDPPPPVVADSERTSRVVHVTVPASVFNHAKAQAYLSGVRWPEFITQLLANAKQLPQEPAEKSAARPSS